MNIANERSERQNDSATEMTLLWTAAQPAVMALIRSIEVAFWQGEKARIELFDLDADIGEANDLADAHPEVVSEMRKTFDVWIAEMAEPIKGGPKVWTPGGSLKNKKLSREEKEAAKEKKRQMDKKANHTGRRKMREAERKARDAGEAPLAK